jgi:hypothetical protein
MAMTLITTNTSSNAASSSFTSSIDSTYKLYIFKFYDVNPVTDDALLTFQANAVDASDYNETITSTVFESFHWENDSSSGVGYRSTTDQAQGTAFQSITFKIGNAADESASGELFLFAPSSTTYVKHFYARSNSYSDSGSSSVDTFVAGYFNITAAIDDIQFKMSTGNMDSVIKMYGVG